MADVFFVLVTWFWPHPHSVVFLVPALLTNPTFQHSWQFSVLPSSLSIILFPHALARLGFHCLRLIILADEGSFSDGRKISREMKEEIQNI